MNPWKLLCIPVILVRCVVTVAVLRAHAEDLVEPLVRRWSWLRQDVKNVWW